MKKIMFNDHYGLTKAVLEGGKTMTRRIIKGYPLLPDDRIEDAGLFPDGYVHIIANGGESLMKIKCGYNVGELVAVAQSYEQIYHEQGLETMDMLISPLKHSKGWSNKMFIRSELMPHYIRITSIRAERLQDITEEDCIKEGIQFIEAIEKYYFERFDKEAGFYFDTSREAFAALTDKVSGRGTWQSNPYVWVYEFELLN